MANKIKLARGTKARIETIKETLLNYEIVYSTDTKEIGVKNNDGTIEYIGKVTELEWANILNKPAFKPVATTGDYNDLTNKPDLALKLDKNFSTLPTQASPLLTDVLVTNRGTVAQKVTLGNILAQVDNEIFVVVANLPTTGVVNKIYLVPKGTPEAQNTYDEFIWVNSAWEKLGTIALDLSNVYNKTEVNGLLDAKVNANNAITAGTSPKITYDAKGLVTGGSALVASDIPNLDAGKITTGTFADARIPTLAISKVTNLQSSLDNKVDKVSGKGLSTNDYTNTDKQSVEKIPTIEQDILDLESDKVDLNEMAYFNYADSIYGAKYSLLANAWQDMKEVDGAEIERESTFETQYGTLQYPNGEDNGVIIPNSVTSIGDWAFSGWTSNNQPLVIPSSVISIGYVAFWNWSSNNQPLVIPNSVTSIDRNAFRDWKANTQPLVIPNSVAGIGSNAFNGWSKVPYVEIYATTPPTLTNADAFNNQNDAPIYVPDDSVAAYKTATNWVDLANRIFPLSDKAGLMDDIADLQENKQDKLVAGENITIDPTTNVISASGSDAYTKEEIDTMIGDIENALDAILGV